MKTIVLFLFTSLCFSQIQKKYIYIDVIQTYERIVAKGYKSADLYKKIGDSYYENYDYKTAIIWYYKLEQLKEPIDYQLYIRYSNALCEMGEWELSDDILNKAINYEASENKVRKRIE